MYRILSEGQTERQCQDAKWGGPAHDDAHSPNDWIAIAARHLGLAANDEAADDEERFRRQMIRLAALAIAAVESRDRINGRVHEYAPKSGPGY